MSTMRFTPSALADVCAVMLAGTVDAYTEIRMAVFGSEPRANYVRSFAGGFSVPAAVEPGEVMTPIEGAALALHHDGLDALVVAYAAANATAYATRYAHHGETFDGSMMLADAVDLPKLARLLSTRKRHAAPALPCSDVIGTIYLLDYNLDDSGTPDAYAFTSRAKDAIVHAALEVARLSKRTA